MPPWLTEGGLVALKVIGLFAFSLFLAAYFNSDFKQGYKAKFKTDLKKAIIHSQPTWEQVLTLATSHNLSKGEVYYQLLPLLRDVLTGDDKELQAHRTLIENYIAAYQATDPDDGLPSETRLHLSRLRDALSDRAHLLEPLAMQLKELVSIYERKQKAQRLYTLWGFLLAIASLAFTGYTYLHPHSVATPDKQAVQMEKK